MQEEGMTEEASLVFAAKVQVDLFLGTMGWMMMMVALLLKQPALEELLSLQHFQQRAMAASSSSLEASFQVQVGCCLLTKTMDSESHVK